MNKSKLESFKDSEISLTLNSATLTRGGRMKLGKLALSKPE